MEVKLEEGFKQAWLKALRSGEFKQGKSYLYNPYKRDEIPRYCCLGVACHVAGLADNDMCLTGMPQSALYELETIKNCPEFLLAKDNETLEVMSNLSQFNDDGVSFETIADYIETNL